MSEPVKVLPMAKLLRLAREKEERERAEKESSAVDRKADESGVKATSNNTEDHNNHISSTIVSETIPYSAIVQSTIVPETILQENIPPESKINKRAESGSKRNSQKGSKKQNKQASDTTISRETIVQQTIVDNSRGYYPVFNDISDRLIPELQLDPYQQAVLQRLYRLTRGWKSDECEVGLGTLAKYCVMSRSQVQRSVAKLIEKGLLESLGSTKKGGKEGNRYRVLPGSRTAPKQTMVSQTIVPETIPPDTIVPEGDTSTCETTVVSQGIVPRSTNKNSNKESLNTHTQSDVGVGSRFSLEECRRFAEHLQKTGQGINNPGGYATAVFRSGEVDAQIEAFLNAPASSTSLKVDECPDCDGSGYYYPEGVEKGVKICKHEKLRGSEQG
jgi:hypothetical protein